MAIKGVASRTNSMAGMFELVVLDYDTGELRDYVMDLPTLRSVFGLDSSASVRLVGVHPARGFALEVVQSDNLGNPMGGVLWAKPTVLGSPVVTTPELPVVSNRHHRPLVGGIVLARDPTGTFSQHYSLIVDGALTSGPFNSAYYTPSGGTYGTEYYYNDFFVSGASLVGYGHGVSFPNPSWQSVAGATSLTSPTDLIPDPTRQAVPNNTPSTRKWLAGLSMLAGYAVTPPHSYVGAAAQVTSISGPAAAVQVVIHGARWDGGAGYARQEAQVAFSGGVPSITQDPVITGPVHTVSRLGWSPSFKFTYDGDWPAESGAAPPNSFWTGLVYSTVIP